MHLRMMSATALTAVFALSMGIANADTLTVTCAGTAATSSITWSAQTTGGVAPIALLWGNGATTSPFTQSAAPGTSTMTIRATDASSSVATSTCSAVVAQPAATTTPTTDLSSQIQALLQQIQQLQEQLRNLIAQSVSQTIGSIASSTPPMFAPGQIGKAMCITLNRDIEEGDQGDDVHNLQDFLASDPRFGFTASSTGFFGPMTAHALMRFQELEDVSSSSAPRVGPMTRGFFERHCGEGLGKHGDKHGEDGMPDLEHMGSSTPEMHLPEGLQLQPMMPAEGGHGHGGDRNDD